jgi:hypothetical protein
MYRASPLTAFANGRPRPMLASLRTEMGIKD